MSATGGRGRCFLVCLTLHAAGLLQLRVASAQSQGNVGVLLQGDANVSTTLADAVDLALIRNLSSQVAIEHPTVAPIAYDEIQLNVGCEGESRSCLALVAETVQVDAIVIRRLRNEGGATTLTLTYFDARSGHEADSVQVSANSDPQSELPASVPSLVRQLFGLPPVVEPPPVVPLPVASVPPTPPETTLAPRTPNQPHPMSRDDGAQVALVTWLVLAGGAAVLASGAVLGVTANSDFEDFKQTTIDSPAAARRAHEDFDAVQSRGTVASALIPIGGVALGIGAVLLVLDLSGESSSGGRDSAMLSIMGTRDGAGLQVKGAFGSGP